MNFLKSVFSEVEDDSSAAEVVGDSSSSSSTTARDGVGGGWGFLRTLASKSESVMETYRRDLEEFGTGFRKETAAFRDVATRAVRDLPVSLEETVSHVFRDDNDDDDDDENKRKREEAGRHTPTTNNRSGRLEVQVMAMQSEESTFLEEPVDSADFESWKSSFDLSEKEDEIDSICRGNPSLKAILLRLVPQSLSFDTFWSRYFYKLHKLTHIHHARTRIIANLHHSHDPDLTWELEEEEEDDNKEKEPPEPHKQQLLTTTMQKDKQQLEKEEEVIAITERNESVVKDVPEAAPDDKSKKGEDEDVGVKLVEPEEKKVSHGDDKLVGAAAKPPSPKKTTSKKEEDDDDLGWDEIGDLGEMDDAKVIITTTSNDALRKSDLRKKLAAQDDDDEDLSWDVEDDH